MQEKLENDFTSGLVSQDGAKNSMYSHFTVHKIILFCIMDFRFVKISQNLFV